MGELTNIRQALLPIMAAIGGVLAPIGIYLVFNATNPETVQGWGVPTATDIAFALGILALLGNRVPSGVRVFLSTLAVADDIIAILVIVGASQRHLQGWKEIAVPALVSCAYFAATCTAMLIAWAGKSSGYASGIQNRYFVPILPLLFLLVPRLVSGARNRTVFATVIALTAFSYFGIAISFLIDWK